MLDDRMVPLAALRQARARLRCSDAEVERLRSFLSEHGLCEAYEARRAAERETAMAHALATQELFQTLARAA
jgi:hypothetical protein